MVTDRAQGPLPPSQFSVSAESKDVTDGMPVSEDSAGVKVAVFSMRWEWVVSADSKGVMAVGCL